MMVALTPPLGPALLVRVDPPTVVFEYVCAEEKRVSGAFFFRFSASFLTGRERGVFIRTKLLLGRNGRIGQECLEAETAKELS